MRRYHRLLPLLLAAVLLLAGACARAEETVQALFINVGKADAALFLLGDQRFLVDTGTKDSYDQLERVLEAYGVQRLDGVLITHTDKDHVGGLKKLLKSDIAVDRVYAGTLHSEKSLEDHPVYEAAEKARALGHIRVRGLMTIPPVEQTPHGNLPYFVEVSRLYVDISRKLYDNSFTYLSMGMSDDFEDAIAAGATMVRVGSAIFGRRHYQ